MLDVPDWPGHLPGQHLDVRLTAEDGYQAERSYSIATPADGHRVTISVERIADGEVSPYLADELRVGDKLELRGPIGGYFVWTPDDVRPLLLVGGGSGIVPLMAMLRARVAAAQRHPRTAARLGAFHRRDHLRRRVGVDRERERGRRDHHDADPNSAIGLDRLQPARRRGPCWPRSPGRPTNGLDRYACGPTGFVETVASGLVALGHDPGNIRTERFGPTGG